MYFAMLKAFEAKYVVEKKAQPERILEGVFP
jgi:hypothetical protein